MDFKETRGRKPIYTREFAQLKELIERKKKATIRQIAIELRGDASLESKKFARYMIVKLRAESKKEGRAFYSIGGKHQFLDSDNYIDACDENRERWAFVTRSLQDLVVKGIRKYPALRKQLANLLGQLQLDLMNYQEPEIKQLPNNIEDDSNN
jgi:hypothetical protein